MSSPASSSKGRTNKTSVPAYVPCHPKDLPVLPHCVASLQRHPQVTAVQVVAPREVEPHCARLGVGYIDETELLDPWFPGDTPFGDRRWYYQQFLKLSIAFAPEAPDRYLIFDADTVLLHPFPLVCEKSDAVLHPRMTEHTEPYYVGMEALFGHPVAYEGSYVAHFMVFRASIVRAMFEEFARVRGGQEDGRQVLREFLAEANRDKVSFSDYETYGHYTRTHHPSELEWVVRRQLNVLYVAPTQAVLARLGRYYDYCSFHAYRRPTNAFHRVAGYSWLSLRLARDRLSRASATATPPQPSA